MIYLYSGTPGSGKSLHQARNIRAHLQLGLPVIANYGINTSRIRKCKGEFVQVDNLHLTPEFLKDYSRKYFKNHRFKEGKIQLYIDECQLLFNCRDWGRGNRNAWVEFFTQHRKYGYDIFLIAQFDRMIDRQIRSLIEYEYKHRKLLNFGWKGAFVFLCTLGCSFIAIKLWYPMRNERVGTEYFRYSSRIVALYDSYMDFSEGASLTETAAGAAPAASQLGIMERFMTYRLGNFGISENLSIA